jgi:hypothetical protein
MQSTVFRQRAQSAETAHRVTGTEKAQIGDFSGFLERTSTLLKKIADYTFCPYKKIAYYTFRISGSLYS